MLQQNSVSSHGFCHTRSMASLESPLAAGTHSKEGKHLKAKNHESCCPVASIPFC